ncbi:MAG: radical SAM protein [Lachnospiraceae bacterium]|nr:radical SAM protein [Lachnospiraceae bacterium]
MFTQNKFTIIIVTRCNLRCKLCCEFVPQNKPFEDIKIEECESILKEYFNVVDFVNTLHLSGGGEPFLHKELARLIESCMHYTDRFEKLMLFTNSTVILSQDLIETLTKYKDKIVVQVSHYGIKPELEMKNLEVIRSTGVTVKYLKYYGDDQYCGGWIDMGDWSERPDSNEELKAKYSNCAIHCKMLGNWRTRDGKVHICTRSQRGMELGLMPKFNDDYVDLFDDSSVEDKRNKFIKITESNYINACKYCSGDWGTDIDSRRYPAAEQMK